MQITKNMTQTINKRGWHLYMGIFATIATLWTLIYFTVLGPDNIWQFPNTKPGISHAATGASVPLENLLPYYAWFFYFTNISNVIFAIVTLTRGITNSTKIFSDKIQVVVGSYMFVVGIVFWAAIGAEDWNDRINKGLTFFFYPNYFFFWLINNFLVHTVTVIFAILLALKGIRNKVKTFPLMFYALIFPIIYYIFAWVLYLVTWKTTPNGNQTYIYGFWDFFHPFNKFNTLMGAIGIGIAFFVGVMILFVLLFLILANNWSKKAIMNSQNIIETQKVVLPTKEYSNENIEIKKTLLTKPKRIISKPKKKAEHNKNSSVAKIHYFIQKSTKTNGWELKLKGGTKATFIANTKQEVQDYYSKHLKKENTLVIIKGQHGQIKKVTKKRQR